MSFSCKSGPRIDRSGAVVRLSGSLPDWSRCEGSDPKLADLGGGELRVMRYRPENSILGTGWCSRTAAIAIAIPSVLGIKDALDELGDDARRRPDAAYFTQVTC